MRSRRRLLHGVAAAGMLLCGLRPAAAQPAGKVLRLGWLRPNAAAAGEYQSLANPAALERLGWVQGRNLDIERRWANGQADRLPELARELVQLRCDALLTVGLSATRAAREATASTPIVFFGNFDPVAAGLVPSLARPGGNVSGVLIAADGTLAPKKMQLLKEAVPRATRFALLSPDDPAMQFQDAEAQRAAGALGVEVGVVTVRAGDHAAAFAAIAAQGAQAVFVAAHTRFVTDRLAIIALARRDKLPTMWEWAEQVRDGGLMAYGSSLAELYERIAGKLDRVFKGARIGDLPIEQPATYGLVLNQGTARAIGLALPRALVLQASEIVN